MVSLGAGSNRSKSSVQTAGQRRNIFQGGLKDIGSALGTFNPGTEPQFIDQPGIFGSNRVRNPNYSPTLDMPEYQGATYADPGQALRLAGGDYDRLESSLRDSQWAPIEALQKRRFSDIDQSVADRGLYTSGISDDTKQDIFATDFMPAYQQATNQATATRYGLEQADNQATNNYNLTAADLMNQFNVKGATERWDAAWKPMEYLLSLYNQTGGTNSKGSGSNAQAGVLT